jgi:hypothetical protein
MPKTPKGLRLEPSKPAPVAQEAVQLGLRDRLGLPADVARGVSWIEAPYALGVLDEPGKITLLDWDAESPAVLSARQRLSEERDWATLRLLEDRYRRIELAKDYRITLTVSHMLHLGLAVRASAYVYVCRIGDSIEVMSPRYRDTQLAGGLTAFPDLP